MFKSIPSSYPKVSNRQKMRNVRLAIQQGELAVLHTNKVTLFLLGLLAQNGGEMTITTGTLGQVHAGMGYEIVPGKTANELVIRLLNGEPDAHTYNDSDSDTGNPVETAAETQTAD